MPLAATRDKTSTRVLNLEETLYVRVFDWDDEGFARWFANQEGDTQLCGGGASLSADYLSIWHQVRDNQRLYRASIEDMALAKADVSLSSPLQRPDEIPLADLVAQLTIAPPDGEGYDDQEWREQSLLALENCVFVAHDKVVLRTPEGMFASGLDGYGLHGEEDWPHQYRVWKDHEAHFRVELVQIMQHEPAWNGSDELTANALRKLAAAIREMPQLANSFAYHSIKRVDGHVAGLFNIAICGDEIDRDIESWEVLSPAIVTLDRNERTHLAKLYERDEFADVATALGAMFQLAVKPGEFKILL